MLKYLKSLHLSLYVFYFSIGSSSFSDKLACEKKRESEGQEREEKALYKTASVTQINLIKELQHSMAESHIIIRAKNAGLQCCNVESSAALWSCNNIETVSLLY